MRSISRLGAIALLLGLAAPERASAQGQSSAAQPAPVTAGFQDGFFVQSADGDNRLLLTLIAQTDGRFALDDPLPITNTFTLRKARPIVAFRVARFFDARIVTEFGNGSATVLDAWFDIRVSPKFRFRSGKDKTPLGYELLQGDAYLLFPERMLVSSLVPNRDVGFSAQGDLSPRFYYAGGVFNGIPDGTNSTADVDPNSGKELAGRVVVQPFRSAGAAAAGALSGLGFNLGGSIGEQQGALPTFRTSVQQAYFSYATGTTANGRRTRFSPAVFYYYRALGVFGEYARSTQAVTRATTTREVTNDAWGVTGSYVLTGEVASDRGVRPANTFDPVAGNWGALQVVGRYSELNVDDGIFAAALAAAGSADTAKQFTVGLNWYPAAYVKFYGTYEKTDFDGGNAPARPTENVILFRAQIGF